MRALGPVLFAVLLAVASGASAQAPPFVGGEIDQDTLLERITRGYPREMRQVGTTSVTLRTELGAIRVAYKPRTDSHPYGYLAEIAAYRVARRLEMDNVPPAIGLRIPRRVMQTAYEAYDRNPEWEPIRRNVRWDGLGMTRGAAIYWIPSMRATELSTEDGIDAVASWLRVDGEVPEGSEDVARDLSTLFAYDYLIGNWDRLSGGNVSTTPEGDRLFVRDHNVAFNAPLTDQRYDRIRGNLERVQRFSRSFLVHVAAADEAALRAAVDADPLSEDVPILAPAQIEGFEKRRRALLSYVGALISVYGADRVIAWP